MNGYRIAAIAAVALLTGCAGLTDVIQQQEQLRAPAPLNAKRATPTAVTTYRQVLKAAEDHYEAAIKKQGADTATLIDAGIAGANANCRAWLAAVSDADRRWAQGEGNISVVENALTAILGAAKASYGLITAYGIGTTALAGFNSNFAHSILSLGQHDIQSAIISLMSQRADDLRRQAVTPPGLTFPQAVDALDDYSRLCSAQTAQAITRSALGSTTVSIDRAGGMTVMPK